MKVLDLSAVVENTRRLLATKQTLLHLQEGITESISRMMLGLNVLDADVTVLSGVVNSLSHPNYDISAGSAYYNGEIYEIPTWTGVAGGGQVAILTLQTTYRSGDPVIYTDGSSQNTHSNRKLVWSLGTSGTGIKDYSQLVRLVTKLDSLLGVTSQVAAAIVTANAYTDTAVTGLWDDRGSFSAAGGAYPSSGGSGTAGAILKGDIWTISVAGTLPTGQVVEVGDTVRALIDTPGNTQANWGILQNNIGYVPVNKGGDTMSGALAMGSNKITGLAAATANGDAVRFEQLPAAPETFGSWTNITLINGWVQGFLLEPPQYRTGPGNMVYLRGYIDGSSNSATACLSGLPAPAKASIFFVGVLGASTSVQYQFSIDTAGGGDIQAQGTINTNNESICLDGLLYATN